MYRNYIRKLDVAVAPYQKVLLVMRLTTVILIATLMQVSASSFGQLITITQKNAPLESVLKEIRRQSGFDIYYDGKTITKSLTTTLSVKQASLQQALNAALKDLNLHFRITDRTVLIERNPLSARKASFIVTGRVTDNDHFPVPGVTVTLKGSGKQTMTDGEGKFSISAEAADDVLVFTSVSMETQEIRLDGRKEINVTLQLKTNALKEITVNTGFQRIGKEKITGATVTVGSAELETRYTPNILNNLEGRVPGLVTYRGMTSIRGVSTINATKNPLVVLDGLPIEGSLADVNPYDVQDITVLKDAAAAAIYGARAANGVIVVTTKRARGRGTSVSFSSDVTVAQKPDLDYNLLSPSQQVDAELKVYDYLFANTGGLYPNRAAAVTAVGNSISNGTPISPVQYAYYQLAKGDISQGQFDEQLAGFRQNNFRQDFKNRALLNDVLQQYDLAVRTSGERFQSSLVANYKNSNGGIINAYNRQLNLFYKGTYEVAPWLDVNYGVNSVLGYVRSANSAFAGSALNVPSYQNLTDAAGNRMYYTTSDYNAYNTNTATQPVSSLLFNHLDELDRDFRNTRQQNTRYYLNMNAKVIPGLTLSPQFQYENNNLAASTYAEAESYTMRFLKSVYTTMLPANGGYLATSNTKGDYWTARGQAEYQRTFGDHAIDAIAGTEFRQTRTRGTGGLLLGYDDQLQSHSTTSVSFPALANFRNTTAFKPGFSTASLYSRYIAGPIAVFPETVHRFNSNYANITYTYNQRYNAFASYRVDYADVFGLDEKFRGKPLWSAGLSWNLHRESFLAQYDWVDVLKLRTTYGVTGNIVQGVSSFLTANSTLFNPVTNQPMSVVTNAANPELRWEKTATFNVGADFAMFGGRLNGAADWYRKKSSDVLVTQRLDPSEGFTSQIINNGGLLNNGIELSLQYDWFRAADRQAFGWNTGLVLSHNKNRITYIDEVATTPIALAQGGYKTGFPVNSLFSYQYRGLSSIGQPQWLTAGGALSTIALTSNDMAAMVYSGTTDPKVNLNLTSEVRYKGFSLYVLAVYYGGQSLRALVPEVVSGVPYGSMPAYIANAWTPENTNTIIPGTGRYAPGVYPGTQGPPAGQLSYSDAFVRNGDFIKIRSAIFGYQLPLSVLSTLRLKGAGLRFQLNNPKALWTRNDVGVDPETGGAAIPTSYVFGLNVNL
ncbi:SusC/RagA family TonB-linked outer membrane protein [Pedobacter deserti]|uniref:SusC/RagA family TonB-linked outer membrane protein n=1 Tax=Pedobacter deserti TaxID=2817382 RepID=UPI0021092965|nr:SusC/RagA family TonB-linked outer membrane protein [Pedobacter sp. SYSU D00382]